MDQRLLDYIEYALKNKSPAYQLGFLRAVIVQLMINDSRNIDIFKQIVSAADKKTNNKP